MSSNEPWQKRESGPSSSTSRPERTKMNRPSRGGSGEARSLRNLAGFDDGPLKLWQKRDGGPIGRNQHRATAEGERYFDRRTDRSRLVSNAPRAQIVEPRVDEPERIAKVMARAGLCSRRDAEAWILEGRVQVNGVVINSPALDISSSDSIAVDNKPLPLRQRTRLFLFHKPRGVVTTYRDPEGRPTVFSVLPKNLPRLIAVGRLDINTEGLLLLTNDGGLARVISLPDTGWLRRYRVRCYGEISQAVLDTLREGITVDDMHYGPIEATIDREKGDNVWLTLGLREGKNREVKRVLEHLGLQVNRLIRLSFGPFQLNELDVGAVEEVRTSVLADQLGPTLIAEGHVDLNAPVFIHEESQPEEARPAGRDRDRTSDRRRGWDDSEKLATRNARERPERSTFSSQETEPRAMERRRHPTEPLRSVWRSGEDSDNLNRKQGKSARRGTDLKASRLEKGQKPRIRSGTVTSRTGRTVSVERLEKPKQTYILPERTGERNARPQRREELGEMSSRPLRETRGEKTPSRVPRRAHDRSAPREGFSPRDHSQKNGNSEGRGTFPRNGRSGGGKPPGRSDGNKRPPRNPGPSRQR
ncbi:MAG: pseudouridine synthase [Hyphomicrobiales bacterium]